MGSFLIPNPLNQTIPIKLSKNMNISLKRPIICIQHEHPKFLTPSNLINKMRKPISENCMNSVILPSKVVPLNESNNSRTKMQKTGEEVVMEIENENNDRFGLGKMSSKHRMWVLCGLGYWVQGFRCFPWLALNFHMANNLHFDPSTLQLVQYLGILPMVAKPLYGVLSDAIGVGGAHRVPYICIGVILQVLSWGPLSSIPFVGEALPSLMACVLLSNLGAAVTEVAQDALVAEYGQKHKTVGLQSYTFMAIAVAGVLGNLFGGVLLSRTHPRVVLLLFTGLLTVQLLVSMSTKEEWLGLAKPSGYLVEQESILSSIKRQFSDLLMALCGDRISGPLVWVVASIAMVPMLTGSMFCYQTQFLNLDPSIIGMSKVIGQVLLLSLAVLYERFWKNIPMRKLMTIVQIMYAGSLLLDLVLVKQINLRMGIPNDVFVFCFSGLAETIAVFKTMPVFVLIGSLCPTGCEASVIAFLASSLTLSTVVSGFCGIGLASALDITSGNYSSLPVGIVLQSLAALVPLIWINKLPITLPAFESEKKKGRSKRSRRNRRVGRVVFDSFFSYRRVRESEKQR